MYCQDCRFSSPNEYGQLYASPRNQFLNCDHPKIVYGEHLEPSERTDDMLIYQDCEGWSASVLVGPKFGCVHFAAKEGGEE